MEIDIFFIPKSRKKGSRQERPNRGELDSARIFYSFFTSVHIYDLHISTIVIHHLDGLFGSNIITSSQLAC